MKDKKSSKLTNLQYSGIVLGIVALLVMCGAVAMNGNQAQEPFVAEIAEQTGVDPTPVATVAASQEDNKFKWEGKIDVFVTRAETGIKEQVVFGEHNLLTSIGANQIRGHLNGTVAAAAISHMSLTNSATAPIIDWTQLPSEITTNGLDRNTAGAGVVNNGTAAFNVTYEWTATATQSAQCVGLHWVATDNTDNNLMSAVQFTQQNLLVNDQLEVVYSVSLS